MIGSKNVSILVRDREDLKSYYRETSTIYSFEKGDLFDRFYWSKKLGNYWFDYLD
jgi:hypothetical protein